MPRFRLSRRQLLSLGAAASSLTALSPGSALARSYKGGVPWQPSEANAPEPAAAGAMQFFTAEEAAFIDAAVSRLIPADSLGPGAKEAGVTTFLDRQLAGPYGRAQSWYMQGPWREGDKTQGYQSRLTPAQVYRAAIRAADEHCRSRFGGRRFVEISVQQQDQVLTALEKGEIKLTGIGPRAVEIEGVTSDTFFAQLMQNTVEGFFSDPIYGGNRDMIGWKLIGFPGAHYDYRAYVSQHGKKLDIAPVGIKGRPGWTPHS